MNVSGGKGVGGSGNMDRMGENPVFSVATAGNMWVGPRANSELETTESAKGVREVKTAKKVGALMGPAGETQHGDETKKSTPASCKRVIKTERRAGSFDKKSVGSYAKPDKPYFDFPFKQLVGQGL